MTVPQVTGAKGNVPWEEYRLRQATLWFRSTMLAPSIAKGEDHDLILSGI